MPIAQDRMLALLSIIDESQATRERLVQLAEAELDEATSEFYQANGNSNPLASNILARLQSLAAAVLDNPKGLSHGSVETLAREREHFRLRSRSNARAAGAMQRRRKQKELA